MAQEQGKALVQTAVTRRARPRRVAAYARCAHRDPDLLERAPVIRRALVAEEPAAVGALEREIHLEAAPVRAARIGPAALVAVDAEPAPKRGRVLRTPPRPVRAVSPVAGDLPEPVDEAFSARITLRLPESLKQRVESAAAREGASVNTWLVQALQRAVESRRPSSAGSRNRLTGYGRN